MRVSLASSMPPLPAPRSCRKSAGVIARSGSVALHPAAASMPRSCFERLVVRGWLRRRLIVPSGLKVGLPCVAHLIDSPCEPLANGPRSSPVPATQNRVLAGSSLLWQENSAGSSFRASDRRFAESQTHDRIYSSIISGCAFQRLLKAVFSPIIWRASRAVAGSARALALSTTFFTSPFARREPVARLRLSSKPGADVPA